MLPLIQEAAWQRLQREREYASAIAQWRDQARDQQSPLNTYGRNHSYNGDANVSEHTEKDSIIIVMVLKATPWSDTAPLVEVEVRRPFTTADEENLRETFKEVYTILRTRGDRWYKIEAIPTQINASTEIKRVVRSTLHHERNKERAAIFKQCFPDIICDEETLEPMKEIDLLEEAGYDEFPLSLLRQRRRMARDDSSDFDREEDHFISKKRAREREEMKMDEDERVSVTEEGEDDGGVLVEPMEEEDWWHPSMSPRSFFSEQSLSNGYLPSMSPISFSSEQSSSNGYLQQASQFS
ncbi:MAG: hypothetical protein Q9212_006334 [Teloschistes hypoglaucus]